VTAIQRDEKVGELEHFRPELASSMPPAAASART
jgi:hypothetical protein